MEEGGYEVKLRVALEPYFGHWCLHLWSTNHYTRINCAAETAGRELLEALSRHCLVDGFALDGSDA